jgi:hypothetical protein
MISIGGQGMDVRILDLDGSLMDQAGLVQTGPMIVPARDWGPRLRLACSFPRFRRFRRFLANTLGQTEGPLVTLYGSGDFHHVSLALLEQLTTPFNLLVLDNHPDWMGGLPFLHCGTWLRHALQLPLVQHVFHVGGDVDFDNAFRWLAPWRRLREGQVTVFPALRRFRGRAWAEIEHSPLRPVPDVSVQPHRLEELLAPYRQELASWPLYVSVDKDVLQPADAVVSWDSGWLHLAEVEAVLEAFLHAAQGNLAGLDLVGDWSAVQTEGWFRRLLHWIEHPALEVDASQARRRNERANLMLLASCEAACAGVGRPLRAVRPFTSAEDWAEITRRAA